MSCAPRCHCCAEAPATVVDPHLGDVCVDCYVELIYVQAAMGEIAPLVGIEGCASQLSPDDSQLP